MWARLTHIKVQTEKVDEFRRIYNEEIVPAVKKQEGIIELSLLELNEKGNEFISFSLWENKFNAEKYVASGTFAELTDKLRNALAETVMVKSYEVKKHSF